MTTPSSPPPSRQELASRPAEPPLDQPYYGASFATAFVRFWKKGLTFTGRASRSEYWFAYLATMVVFLGLYIIAVFISTSSQYTYSPAGGAVGGFVMIVAVLYGLAMLIPQLAITWRRLHDTNKSGGMYFLGWIPFVGGIIFLILVAMESDPAGARYDISPYGARPDGYAPHPASGYARPGQAPPSPYSSAPNPFIAGAAPVPPHPQPEFATPVPPPPAAAATVAGARLVPPPPPPAPSAAHAVAVAPPPPPVAGPADVPQSVVAAAFASAPPAAASASVRDAMITAMPGVAPIGSAVEEDADDLDRTRMSAPREDGWAAELPDGRRIPLSVPLYVGRAPVAEPEHPQAMLVPTDDPAKSMSKTHARIVPAGYGVDITDLHSTNGTVVTPDDGSPVSLTPGVAQHVECDAAVSFGDYVVRLRRSGR